VETREAPLIVHVIHALGVGGLENGLVNLVNHMPAGRYRHAIVCMTHFTDFRYRIKRSDVDVVALNRGAVPLWQTYITLVKTLRKLRPSIVHSRNLSGLDALVPAFLAGVSARVHGEHGRDADDVDGRNAKYRRLRRMFRPLVTRYTAVSKDLQRYLIDQIGVSARRITQIYNGVDTDLFRPRDRGLGVPFPVPPGDERTIRIGTVGRLQAVKDHVTLVKAFAEAVRLDSLTMRTARLVIAGEGVARAQIEAEIARSGVGERVALLGERDDIPEVLRSLDLFVLPSLSEGISNTLLEAMATGLPVLATRVGGNTELVVENETGQLVNPGDWQRMANWLVTFMSDARLRERQGLAARQRAEEMFSMNAMVHGYTALYDRLLEQSSESR
jgi:sugar transferase (PEP-CTERM/EpsH1 system associated)